MKSRVYWDILYRKKKASLDNDLRLQSHKSHEYFSRLILLYFHTVAVLSLFCSRTLCNRKFTLTHVDRVTNVDQLKNLYIVNITYDPLSHA